MGAMLCPACKGDEERTHSCDFCGRRGYVPDGSGPLPSRWGLGVKVLAVVLGVFAVVYFSFLFPRDDQETKLLRDGLRNREGLAAKDIDIVKDERGGWSFGTVTAEDGTRYAIAAKWSVDRTGDKHDKWKVEWVLGRGQGGVEMIEWLKANKEK